MSQKGFMNETFNFDILVQVIILVYSLRKKGTELMAKVNLGQTKLSHVSES